MTTPVSVLGMGPMGRAIAAAFAADGHDTTVWNRTPNRADGLPVAVAATAREAVSAAPIVVVCVVDNTVARAILDDADLTDRLVVNLSSGSPDRTRELAVWVGQRGGRYLDGVIMAAPAAIGGPDASLLLSGELSAEASSVLAGLGGTTYLGDDPGRAAAYDVALQDAFWHSLGGVVHAYGLAAAEGIAPAELADRLKAMIGMSLSLVDVLAEHMASGVYPGDESNLHSAAAAIGQVIQAAGARGLDAGGLPGLLALTRRAIDAGHGEEAVSRVATVLAF